MIIFLSYFEKKPRVVNLTFTNNSSTTCNKVYSFVKIWSNMNFSKLKLYFNFKKILT